MGVLATIGNFLFGAGAKGAVTLAQGVNGIVSQYVPTLENKEGFTKDLITLVNQDNASARAFGAPGVHNTAFDALVDGINRLIRPWVAVMVIGAWCGWWRLPALAALPAFEQQLVWLVVTFYFGGRAITKDVPQALAYYFNAVKRG